MQQIAVLLIDDVYLNSVLDSLPFAAKAGGEKLTPNRSTS